MTRMTRPGFNAVPGSCSGVPLCHCDVVSHSCDILQCGCHGCGVLPSGCVVLPRGCGVLPSGCVVLPCGCVVLPSGCGVLPRGCVVLPHGCYALSCCSDIPSYSSTSSSGLGCVGVLSCSTSRILAVNNKGLHIG